MKQLLLCLVMGMVLSGCLQVEQQEAGSADTAIEKKTSRRLVEALKDDSTIGEAVLELCRRNGETDCSDYRNFRLYICPQKMGDPLYVVLCDFLSSYVSKDGYKIEDPDSLFGKRKLKAGKKTAELEKLETLLILVFKSDGTSVQPFGGNNVISGGILCDINGDGIIERADHINYGLDGVDTITVFHVDTVEEKHKTILSVLYNWGDREELDYRFSDNDNDGLVEIEFGHGTKKGFKADAVFVWDKKQGKYVTEKGDSGDHYRVLDSSANIWDQLEAFKKAGLQFREIKVEEMDSSKQIGATPLNEDEPNGDDVDDDEVVVAVAKVKVEKKEPQEIKSKPYKYSSLKSLSDEEIFEYMGEGNSLQDLEYANEQGDRIPKDFWKLSPKDAALKTADLNRTEQHKKEYQIAIDDRGGEVAPEKFSISYVYYSRRCYTIRDGYYFLRVDPENSYLAYAGITEAGVVFYNFMHTIPSYDLRWCKIDYKTAKHLAQTIWWMERIRTRRITYVDDSGGMMMSTADGNGALRIRTDGSKKEYNVIDRVPAFWISTQWTSNYDRAIDLHFTDYLLTSALPDKLGNTWKSQAPKKGRKVLFFPERGPLNYTEEETKRLHKICKACIEAYSADETNISVSILAQAVQAAGNLQFADLASELQVVKDKLPDKFTRVRTSREIYADLDEPEDDNVPYEESSARRDKLYEELNESQYGIKFNKTAQKLKSEIALTLKKFKTRKDLDSLMVWVQRREPDFQWALSQLEQQDKERYLTCLEQMLKGTEKKWKRQVFAEIQRVDKKRAQKLALEMPASDKAMAVDVYSVLEKANMIDDQDKRLDALIEIVIDPKSSWEQRGGAVDLLVPPDNPLKYRDRKIDKALLEAMKPELADDSINFTLRNVVRALCLRGRIEYFDKLLSRLKTTRDQTIYQESLASIVLLAVKGGKEYVDKLIPILERNLKATSMSITAIVKPIWVADIRELAPDLERIATSSPSDYEGEKAYSYGGDPTPVTERYHMPRKILAIWNEEDRLTRSKLFIAFMAGDGFSYHLRDQMIKKYIGKDSDYTKEQKAELEKVIERIEKDLQDIPAEMRPADIENMTNNKYRKALGLKLFNFK